MIYHCQTHGKWESNITSGCPDCVSDARKIMAKLEAQIVALKSDIDRFKKKNKSLREQLALADEVVEAAKDCNVWGGKQAEKLRDTIARYDEGRKR